MNTVRKSHSTTVVLKKAPQAAKQASEADKAVMQNVEPFPMRKSHSNDDGENPVLTKVKATLSSTKPEKWIQFAEDLNLDKRYPKPVQNWERVYALDLPNGLLAVRSSQPVRCDYFAGGYAISPVGLERCTIELRQKSWSPKGLVDPYHFSASTNQLQYQILLDGEDAKELFLEVRRILKEYDEGRRGSFVSQTEELLQDLLSKLGKVNPNEWQKESEGNGITQYVGIVDGLTVACIKVIDESENISYYLSISNGEHFCQDSYRGLAREAFELVHGIYRHAALLSFSEVLDGVAK